MTLNLNEEIFDEALDNSDGKVVVDFWAVWCGPCRMLTPTLERIEAEHDISVFKVNVDENPELARRYGVMSIPTMILFNEDGSSKTIVGVKPKSVLEKEFGLTT